MPSLVKLQNGDLIHAEEDVAALVKQFNASRRDGTLIKIDLGDNDTVWINPHVLATIRERESSPEPMLEVMS